jgi:hypothetical protein
MVFPTAPNLGFVLCPCAARFAVFLYPFVFFISFLNCEICCGKLYARTVSLDWMIFLFFRCNNCEFHFMRVWEVVEWCRSGTSPPPFFFLPSMTVKGSFLDGWWAGYSSLAHHYRSRFGYSGWRTRQVEVYCFHLVGVSSDGHGRQTALWCGVCSFWLGSLELLGGGCVVASDCDVMWWSGWPNLKGDPQLVDWWDKRALTKKI